MKKIDTPTNSDISILLFAAERDISVFNTATGRPIPVFEAVNNNLRHRRGIMYKPKAPNNERDDNVTAHFHTKLFNKKTQPEGGPIWGAFSILEIRYMETVGAIFKAARNKKDQTLEEASATFGIDNSTLSRIEQGQRMPSEDLCKKMAEEYDLPKTQLTCLVERLKNNEKAQDPQSALSQYLELTKELENDLEAGRISMETAETIVSAWEGALKEARKMRVKHNQEGGPNASRMLDPVESRETVFRKNTL